MKIILVTQAISPPSLSKTLSRSYNHKSYDIFYYRHQGLNIQAYERYTLPLMKTAQLETAHCSMSLFIFIADN